MCSRPRPTLVRERARVRARARPKKNPERLSGISLSVTDRARARTRARSRIEIDRGPRTIYVIHFLYLLFPQHLRNIGIDLGNRRLFGEGSIDEDKVAQPLKVTFNRLSLRMEDF